MNTKDAFPAVAAATPLLPLIAPFAAPILIGGAIAAGLIWLFSGDETPAAETANAGPDALKALTDTERTQRVREIETELARDKRELYRLNAPRTVAPPAVRTVTHQATRAVAASHRPAPAQAVSAVVTPAHVVATAATHRAVTPTAQPAQRDAAPMIAPRPATPQAAPAVAASVTAPEKPGRFQLRAQQCPTLGAIKRHREP